MPGFDGTGPAGMGPMTGGGRGWCTPYGRAYTGYTPHRVPYAPPAQPYYRGRPAAYSLGRPRWWLGRGFGGRGRGEGRGRGRGRGRW